jgi:hypothetical protein
MNKARILEMPRRAVAGATFLVAVGLAATLWLGRPQPFRCTSFLCNSVWMRPSWFGPTIKLEGAAAAIACLAIAALWVRQGRRASIETA